jgi:hypothetical protein
VRKLTLNKQLKVSIPITAQMISFTLNRKKPSFIKSLTVSIQDPYIYLACVFNTKLIPFPIKLAVVPLETNNGRELHFKIKKIHPRWLRLINIVVINKHPLIKVKKGYITLNLNGIASINKIKNGKIKGMKVNKNILWCQIKI